MKLLTKLINKLAFYLYCAFKKGMQSLAVLKEHNPVFSSDEIVAPVNGKHFAIIVKYHLIGITDDFVNLLKVLHQQGVNSVVVCNGDLLDKDLSRIKPFVYRILVRKNVGQDFGAYRSASIHLHREGLNAERILYLNDSVIYAPGSGLEEMVKQLLECEYDVVGANENHEILHHVGSFALSVSGKVFNDKRVQRFWKKYRPYSLRPYVIRQGELELSKCFRECGYRIDVIYSADKLAQRLYSMSLAELIDKLRYVPYNRLREYSLADCLASAAETGKFIVGSDSSKDGKLTPRLSDYRAYMSDTDGIRKNKEARIALADRMLVEVLVNEIMKTFLSASQVHFGFGLFHRVLGSPIIKRDLLKRNVMLEHDCLRIIEHLPNEFQSSAMRQLINRGRPVYMTLLQRFKFINGLD